MTADVTDGAAVTPAPAASLNLTKVTVNANSSLGMKHHNLLWAASIGARNDSAQGFFIKIRN